MDDKTFADLVKELQVYQWHLETSGGEITPEIEAMERHLAVAFGAKGRAIQYVVDRLEALAKADGEDAERYRKSAKAKYNAVNRLWDMIKAQMVAAGQDLVEGDGVQFILRDSAPRIEIDDAHLPATYWREELVRTPDRKQIEFELKQGHEVPGAKLVPVKALLMKKGRRA